MKLWFAIPLGWAMLVNPKIALWFVLCCIVLVLIFGPIAAAKSARKRP